PRRAALRGLAGGRAGAAPAGARPGGAGPSPAEAVIAAARKMIQEAPARPEGYTRLAFGLARRARETSDPSLYAEAHEAIKKARARSPDDFEAGKAEVWALLGQHEFAKALEGARRLNRRAPDDVMVYGMLTDACVELGDYAAAERAAQWMLDLRPGAPPALTRSAYLRELFGDEEGAAELLRAAYEHTAETETEDRAWILTQLAHLQAAAGNFQLAEELSTRALALFPDYHYATGQLAEVRAGQKRYAEAAALLEKRYRDAPHAENLYALAEALERAGRTAEARKAYADFEAKALAESTAADNANHELVAYYVDHARKPAEARRIAGLELGRRRDARTLAAHAWALAAGGDLAGARAEMERALSVGLKDPRMLWQAGSIALRAGDRKSAERYLRQAAARGWEPARAALRKLAAGGAAAAEGGTR
ncbi:MAG: tetratricopeptide repeat protein, partial [Polyangiaceae bacterium]|nr:tetratricopeptide repeat protein [Polyangiaceae bacterium]